MAPSKRRRVSSSTPSMTSSHKRLHQQPSQSTLSFSRTKPNLPSRPSNTSTKSATEKPVKPFPPPLEPVKPEPKTPPNQDISNLPSRAAEVDVTADANAEEQEAEQEREQEQEQDPDEAKARSIPDSQITQYWTRKQRARKAPRVHQEALGVREKILREFDVSGRFGPCVGIDRTRRWKRARDLGLEPPVEVLAVLLREREREREHGGGSGNGITAATAEKSVVDELISGVRAGPPAAGDA